jgi:16S rRNA (cytosine1402-N4)-methyltransferase
MRMDKDTGEPASVYINSLSAKELADIFRKYGEEKYAWRIACGIERARKNYHIETTGQLVSRIREILPAPVQRKMGGHPARKIFQALRIHVNRELDALSEGLAACAKLACADTELVIVSYHSLEDRIVKHTFLQWQREGFGEILTKHPILPSDEETSLNFKSRSAKLRAFRFRLRL